MKLSPPENAYGQCVVGAALVAVSFALCRACQHQQLRPEPPGHRQQHLPDELRLERRGRVSSRTPRAGWAIRLPGRQLARNQFRPPTSRLRRRTSTPAIKRRPASWITNIQLQAWSGAAWTNIPGGAITNTSSFALALTFNAPGHHDQDPLRHHRHHLRASPRNHALGRAAAALHRRHGRLRSRQRRARRAGAGESDRLPVRRAETFHRADAHQRHAVQHHDDEQHRRAFLRQHPRRTRGLLQLRAGRARALRHSAWAARPTAFRIRSSSCRTSSRPNTPCPPRNSWWTRAAAWARTIGVRRLSVARRHVLLVRDSLADLSAAERPRHDGSHAARGKLRRRKGDGAGDEFRFHHHDRGFRLSRRAPPLLHEPAAAADHEPSGCRPMHSLRSRRHAGAPVHARLERRRASAPDSRADRRVVRLFSPRLAGAAQLARRRLLSQRPRLRLRAMGRFLRPDQRQRGRRRSVVARN